MISRRVLSVNLSSLSRCYVRFSSSSPSDEVKLERLSGDHKNISVVGLNRPVAKNAFSRSLVNQLTKVIDELKYDKESRVVILRSLVPGIFCAGADLKERNKQTQDEIRIFVNQLRALLISIEQLPMPVIGAVDGPALGGGLEMALACDIRTASEDAKLGLVETRLAIIPGAGGTQRLPRILGPALAKELIFTSRVLSGSEAYKLGVVNHVVPQNDVKDAAYQKALMIAAEIAPNGPLGIKMAKKAIDKGIQVDIGTGYAIEEACYAQILPTTDRLEGLKAFAEKRKPVYKGE